MKKLFLLILPLLIFISLIFINKKDENLNKIKVAEVTHSIFYAPQYVAHSLGYFSDEGLDVEFILTPGADKVSAAVLSGDVQIGFCGSEATIYIYNNGEEDYLVNFAGLTKKDGSFLVSKNKIDNFTVDNLKNKTIIGGRKSGMPEMTLEYTIKKNNLDPKKDMYIDTSIDFASMPGAFIQGKGDFVTLFEPNALELEKQGYGYVVASVGELGGTVPYTSYNAKKSYIENNKETILKFTNAIQKGLDYVHNNDAKNISKLLIPYFPNISQDDLIKIINRYKNIDAWYKTTKINENDFNHVQEIIKSAGFLDKKVDYKKLVIN